MAEMMGISNHPGAFGQNSLGTRANPMAGSTNGSSSTGTSSGDSVGIGANDFLTLLVTEMKNQDPTANTDPNAYINQLVQVNSLQQLIAINENLTAALGTSAAKSDGSSPASQSTQGTASSAGVARPRTADTVPAGVHKPATQPQSAPEIGPVATRLAHGNLSIPQSSPASHRVAQALGGRRPA